MSCFCISGDASAQFDRKRALEDRARYERKGPDTTTRLLLEELEPVAQPDDTLLDIGGGIGVLDIELHLRVGLREAVLVDAAPDSVAVARELWNHYNTEPERLRTIAGDVTEISAAVTAEIVTLDRVVCCYPDVDALLRTAARSATKTLALSYPKNRWYIRAVFAADNFRRRLARNSFRTFVHPREQIRSLLESAGLRRGKERSTFVWQVECWSRPDAVA